MRLGHSGRGAFRPYSNTITITAISALPKYTWPSEHSNMLFVVATEAHDDDGLPHTLEHLVFMGSEKYPYKVGEYSMVTLEHI